MLNGTIGCLIRSDGVFLNITKNIDRLQLLVGFNTAICMSFYQNESLNTRVFGEADPVEQPSHV